MSILNGLKKLTWPLDNKQYQRNIFKFNKLGMENLEEFLWAKIRKQIKHLL